MKKILLLIFSAALCVTFAACNNSQVDIDGNGGNSLPHTVPTVQETEEDKRLESDKPVDSFDNMYDAYFAVLENLIQNRILPDGIDPCEQSGDMSENEFTVCDVDNDGRDELILIYTTTCGANWAGYVLDYDEETKELKTQLKEFTMLTFYDNGIVKAGWSHNQGLAGDFWPYSLYQYVPDSDSYILVGMVDAWDKNYFRSEEDIKNNPFPSDIDKSGTGFVYYVMEDGKYDNTHPIDVSEYNEWIGAHIGDASKIHIQYKALTEENISQLKTAKHD